MQNRIKEQIVNLGKTQIDVAETLGITTVAMSQLANAKMPKIETLEKIAKAIGVPTWKLLLSDEEIEEIRQGVEPKSNAFRCPRCGSYLKVVPIDNEEYEKLVNGD